MYLLIVGDVSPFELRTEDIVWQTSCICRSEARALHGAGFQVRIRRIVDRNNVLRVDKNNLARGRLRVQKPKWLEMGRIYYKYTKLMHVTTSFK